MERVIQFRAGAPDKIFMYCDGSYEMIKRDMTNLVDYSYEELVELQKQGFYLLPADEGDVRYANELYEKGLVDQSFIMLPLQDSRVINYDEFVPKDSQFYQGITENTMLTYPRTVSYTIEEFKHLDWKSFGPCAIKVQIGSGSRGVVVYNPHYYVANTREQVRELTQDHIDSVIAQAEKTGCKIMVQDLCRTDLEKYELQIIIRHGKMLCYKWEHPDNPSTNWDHGRFIRTPYTDAVAQSVYEYFIKCGITDCISGMDGYTNYVDYTDVMENNFRWENCTFTWEALGIDPISTYLNCIDQNHIMPYTDNNGIPYVRYWRAKLISEAKNYKVGK